MEEDKKLEHLAIILDGNRRWAKEHGLNSSLGHKKGAEVLENIVKYCNKINMKYLTVYAFSTENWKRTEEEVGYLMILLQTYLDKLLKSLNMDNVKMEFIGNIEGLPEGLQNRIHKIEEKTKNNTGLDFMMAFNYGGRDEIVRATKKIYQKVANGEINIEDITEQTITDNLYTAGKKDPDMVIRTSGELRTSNFLPWQITYSELFFMNKYWPDFTETDIDLCVEEFSKRHIRKGK
jgi:undecaprenyl diphosphate synthase